MSKSIVETVLRVGISMGLMSQVGGSVLVSEPDNKSKLCSELVSEKKDGKYWNPMVEKYSNVPWFKFKDDLDPYNKNAVFETENILREECGLPLLEVVDLSSSNADVNLSLPIPRGRGPVVKGMKFKAYLCEEPECYSGTPLYVRNKVKK